MCLVSWVSTMWVWLAGKNNPTLDLFLFCKPDIQCWDVLQLYIVHSAIVLDLDSYVNRIELVHSVCRILCKQKCIPYMVKVTNSGWATCTHAWVNICTNEWSVINCKIMINSALQCHLLRSNTFRVSFRQEIRCEVSYFKNILYSLAGAEMAFTFKRQEV